MSLRAKAECLHDPMWSEWTAPHDVSLLCEIGGMHTEYDACGKGIQASLIH